jgi:alkylhydroperoxidase/carboxymuconolactone decarboxylase family protein YurZ
MASCARRWVTPGGRIPARRHAPSDRSGRPRSCRSGRRARTAACALDARTATLARFAANIAVDAAPSSIQHAVALALAAGATSSEIVATLEAITPVTGAARVVSSAPKVALALGYDVEDALESLDP